jgi:hypothetical protein
MNSFDVFDTLLARRNLNSDPIWHHLQQEFGIDNFVTCRKAADTGARNLEEIYNKLVDEGVVSYKLRNTVYRRELELEIESAIPIQENLDRVQHGDLLISDMYMPASAILQMVRQVGLDKQVTIYQSNGDKSNGTIWPKLENNRPGVHLGDNRHSDVSMPQAAGFTAELCTQTHFTTDEYAIFENYFSNIALLVRESRLAFNGIHKQHFAIANTANLPMLFVLAELIHRRYENRNVVMLGRDCQLLQRIYNAYYNETTPYLPFSRAVAFNQPSIAVEYLQSHSPTKPVFVDISSTGGTWERLLSDIEVCVAIYSDQAYYTPSRPALPKNFSYLTTNTEIGQTNLLIEMFNCGDHGHLDSLTQIKGRLITASFAKSELPESLVNVIHTPVGFAVKQASIYKDAIRNELAALDTHQLVAKFGEFAMRICSQHQLLNDAQSFLSQETKYLEQFTNENS